MIIRIRVGSVFTLMHAIQIYTEERIGQPARLCHIRKIGVNNYKCNKGQEKTESELVESDKGILGPENVVVICVEEVAVLL
jgi:hypothetical protein